jgi:hypothetical protein
VLGCSVYDYVKIALETDIINSQTKRIEKHEDSKSASEIAQKIRKFTEQLEASCP